MLYGLLLTVFIILGVFIILFVLIQQSKSSLGLGAMGGEAQMLFGGSGGQNFFQKATWIMGGLFMVLSLYLALMRSTLSETRFIKQISSKTPVMQDIAEPKPMEQAPTTETAPENKQ